MCSYGIRFLKCLVEEDFGLQMNLLARAFYVLIIHVSTNIIIIGIFPMPYTPHSLACTRVMFF
jgi:hypothetical protein